MADKCARCGLNLPHQVEDCVSELVQRRVDAEKACQSYLLDLHFALAFASRLEWLDHRCPQCESMYPDHKETCPLDSFLNQTCARTISRSYSIPNS